MHWDKKDDWVKYIYGVCFLLIVTLTTLFAFQNSGTVNLSLLFTQITLPMSVLIVMIYFLGMFTGGLLITLLRALMRNMTQKTDKKVWIDNLHKNFKNLTQRDLTVKIKTVVTLLITFLLAACDRTPPETVESVRPVKIFMVEDSGQNGTRYFPARLQAVMKPNSPLNGVGNCKSCWSVKGNKWRKGKKLPCWTILIWA